MPTQLPVPGQVPGGVGGGGDSALWVEAVKECGPSIACYPIIMLTENGNLGFPLIFCVGKKMRMCLKVAYLLNKTPLGVAVNPFPSLGVDLWGPGNPPVDHMGGLCSSLQILKSQGRKVPFSLLTGCNDDDDNDDDLVPTGIWVLSHTEEANAVEKLREIHL